MRQIAKLRLQNMVVVISLRRCDVGKSGFRMCALRRGAVLHSSLKSVGDGIHFLRHVTYLQYTQVTQCHHNLVTRRNVRVHREEELESIPFDVEDDGVSHTSTAKPVTSCQWYRFQERGIRALKWGSHRNKTHCHSRQAHRLSAHDRYIFSVILSSWNVRGCVCVLRETHFG